jgi:predicted amidophosphoribosyltransferase
MDLNKSAKLKTPQTLCSKCHKKISIGEEYHYNTKIFCENCCMDMQTVRTRKTHWQYIGSIKGDYLIPGKNG